jgi:tripartite-type tricarboxylate transporter receptor subunit TctC
MIRLVSAAVVLAGLFIAPMSALAQIYPSQAVTIVVPFSAGGGPDILARRIAQQLTTSFGQPVIVDNRVGAGGRVGTEAVAKAAPNGYTVLLGTSSSLAIAPALYKDLPYDPEKSFAPVSLAVYGPMVLAVRKSLPVADLNALIAYAKENPGRLNFGSTGLGSVHHLAGELLQQTAGIKMTHIPYRGGAPAWTALVNGEIDVLIDALFGGGAPVLQAGTAKALGVTGSERISALADVPTFSERGIHGFDVSFWWGFAAPAGTPKSIVERLNKELTVALEEPGLRRSFSDLSLELTPSTPDAFGKLIAENTARWRSVVDKAAIKPE